MRKEIRKYFNPTKKELLISQKFDFIIIIKL
jgi:hypothetical protein